MENFIMALHAMGMGMAGIFSVTVVLIAVMAALTRLFPAGTEEE